MELIVFILLALYFLPLYIFSWVAYYCYNFGIAQVISSLPQVDQPQVFWITILVYIVLLFIKFCFSKDNQATIVKILDLD
jgi:hypothetical protein